MIVHSQGSDAEGKPTLQRGWFFAITPTSFSYQNDRSSDNGKKSETEVLRIEARRVAAVARDGTRGDAHVSHARRTAGARLGGAAPAPGLAPALGPHDPHRHRARRTARERGRWLPQAIAMAALARGWGSVILTPAVAAPHHRTLCQVHQDASVTYAVAWVALTSAIPSLHNGGVHRHCTCWRGAVRDPGDLALPDGGGDRVRRACHRPRRPRRDGRGDDPVRRAARAAQPPFPLQRAAHRRAAHSARPAPRLAGRRGSRRAVAHRDQRRSRPGPATRRVRLRLAIPGRRTLFPIASRSRSTSTRRSPAPSSRPSRCRRWWRTPCAMAPPRASTPRRSRLLGAPTAARCG